MIYSGIVVTYYPTEENFKNIQRIAKQVDVLFVVDNTDIEVFFPKFSKNVKIVKNRKNYGIAYALNKGLLLSKNLDVKGVFLFDQDTSIPNDFVEKMKNFRESIKDEKVILFSPNFFDVNAKEFASFFYFEKFKIRRIDCKGIIYPSLVITSGSLLDIKAIDQIGYFNENLFIDLVDNEYCFRIWEKGYKIAVNCNITINHSIGKRNVKKLLFFKIKPNNHNPIRKYYIIRNSILMIRKYGKKYPSILFWNLMIIIHTILSTVLYENLKLKKIKYISRGFFDGLFKF